MLTHMLKASGNGVGVTFNQSDVVFLYII